jgi:DNA polymerase
MESGKKELKDIMDGYLQHLYFLREAGVTELPLRQASVSESPVSTPSKPVPSGEAAAEKLVKMAASLEKCTRCKLHQERTHVVFGEGNPEARLMFVGEGPGRDEDRQGIPFVGRAGKLLTDIISAMKMSREEVYIANIVKCRPPGNRNPEPDEVAACLPFLLKQIGLIRPDIICALGSVAFQTLFGKKVSITRFRGAFYPWQGNCLLLPTYHPAYLLRNPAKKREVWEDVQKIMAYLSE